MTKLKENKWHKNQQNSRVNTKERNRKWCCQLQSWLIFPGFVYLLNLCNQPSLFIYSINKMVFWYSHFSCRPFLLHWPYYKRFCSSALCRKSLLFSSPGQQKGHMLRLPDRAYSITGEGMKVRGEYRREAGEWSNGVASECDGWRWNYNSQNMQCWFQS